MQRRQDPLIRIKRVPREKEARVRIGSFEFKKKGGAVQGPERKIKRLVNQ